MPQLLFACPSCGHELASGIHTDEQSLASVAQMSVTLQCPACRKMHQVTANRGYFEEAAVAAPGRRHAAAPTRESRVS
jgi:transcription elongation factor Elf1